MASSRVSTVITLLTLLLSAAGLVIPQHSAVAQYDAARYELIAEVNGLRASWGLLPYTVDAGLMALAQEHAAYLASIHQGSHRHSDGSYPPDLGVVENVASGDIGFLDPWTAVYEVWSDLGHLRTMVAFAEGSLGVGIADDGETVFYVLEVRPTPESAATAGPGPDFPRLPTADLSQFTAQPYQPLQPMVTTTPQPDGSLVHVVAYGQTLWEIALAYGVTIDQMRAWNGIAQDSTTIYEGQKLLVRLAQPTTKAGLAPAESPAVPTPSIAPGLAAGSTPSPAPPATLQASPAAAGSLPTRLQPTSGEGARSRPSGSLLPALAGISVLSGIGLFVLAVILRRSGKEPRG